MSTNPFSENPFVTSSAQSVGGFFDIRFTRFITTTWITIIWVFLIIAHTLVLLFAEGALLYALAHSGSSEDHGYHGYHSYQGPSPLWLLFLMLLWPVIVAGSLVAFRMMLEIIIILFRTEGNTRVTKDYHLRKMKMEKWEE